MKTKVCGKCKQAKPIEEFHRDKSRKDGHYTWCKNCSNEAGKFWRRKHKEQVRVYGAQYYAKNKKHCRKLIKRWRQAHKDHSRNKYLKRVYGITSEQYEEILIGQKECCAICGDHQSKFKRRLHVDHNHETGEIRGLLCTNCNRMLGHAQDSKDILMRGVQYLG